MNTPRATQKVKRWITLLFLLIVGFIFRKSLLIGVVKIALAICLSGKTSTFTYEKMSWDEEGIHLNNVSFANKDAAIFIDRIHWAFGGSWLSWQGHCTIFHPRIHMHQGGCVKNLPLRFLEPLRFFKMHWELQEGVIQVESHNPLFFSFLPNEGADKIGTLALCHASHDTPFLTAQMDKREELEMRFSLCEKDFSRLYPFLQTLFTHSPKEWEKWQGEISVDGTGTYHDKNSFLLACEVRCETAKENPLRADVSFCRYDQDKYAIQCNCRNVPAEKLSVFVPFNCTDCHLEGNIEGKATYLYEEGISHIRIEEGKWTNMVFGDADKRWIAEEIRADLSLSPSENNTFHIDTAALVIQEAESSSVKHINGSINIQDEKVFSRLKACLSGIDTEVQCEGTQNALIAKVHAQAEEAFAVIPPFITEATACFNAGEVTAHGELCFGGEKVYAGLQWRCNKTALSDLLFQPALSLDFIEGWLETERITENTYGPLLRELPFNVHVTGEMQVNANFDPSYAVVSLKAKDCLIQQQWGDFFIPSLGDGLELLYSFEEKKCSGEFSLQDTSTFNFTLDCAQRSLWPFFCYLDRDNVHVLDLKGTVHYGEEWNASFEAEGRDLVYANEKCGSFTLQGSLTDKALDIAEYQCVLQMPFLKKWTQTYPLPFNIQEIYCPDDVLEMSGKMHYSKEGLTCRGFLKEGIYGFKEYRYPLSYLTWHLKEDVLTLQTKTLINEQPFWAALNLPLTQIPQGIACITDDPQKSGLRLYFKMQDDCCIAEKIQGTCCGLTCALLKNSEKSKNDNQVLSGRIDIDMSIFSSVLHKEILQKSQLGKGYRIQGDLMLSPFKIRGNLIGEGWELFGYRFNSLRSELNIEPERVLLSNIRIQDEAGNLTIKKMLFEKKENWELDIPLVNMLQWDPSHMHKVGSSSLLLKKPFSIRNFSLSDIHVSLDQKDSLKGQGYLTFTNQCETQTTLVDAKSDNFVSDQKFLTPISGEIEFELKGDKLYLTSMKDAFSEAKRCLFYLSAENRSYIDLDGNMHIDLKMKQEESIQPCALTIQGTLDNPRYVLH